MSGGHYGRYRRQSQRPGGAGSVRVGALSRLETRLDELWNAAPDPRHYDDAQLLQHTKRLRRLLEEKQQRELDYLRRRAQRGVHTPTDMAYEQEQILEEELLVLLDMMIAAGEQVGQENGQ